MGNSIQANGYSNEDFVLSGDGRTIAVCSRQAPYKQTCSDGGVLVFRYNDVEWITLGGDGMCIPCRDFLRLTIDLSFDGNTMAVFSDRMRTVDVRVYNEEENIWVSTMTWLDPDDNENQQREVQMSGDGTYIALSDTLDHNDTRIVQTFERAPSGKWWPF